ncbi:AfsR/SARP family transcriptional regulator [Streptomyces sp. SBT349]|uniref:AfsR/SARP family transcriptional regulator n=1 Tax=Streptomyces sp. SBT349 TaxID=1580539 RepID=UPI00066B54BB|nr:BTAD domain-containing putative transcriptional regulator [Streptomyces sp. SBT349]
MPLLDAAFGHHGNRQLHIAVLGRLHVTFHGGDDGGIDVTGPLAPRHRELLAYLTLHPTGVHRDVLCVALWPNAPRDRPHNAFHATLSQLRRALRTTAEPLGDTVRHHDGHYALNTDLVTVDLWQLQDALAAHHRAGSTPQRLAALRTIGDLYGGDFAADVAGDWAETPRERLRRDVLDAHSTLIRALRDSDPEQTLALLEQARGMDPHNEAIYRGIARVQALLGHYDAISRTLSLLATALAEIDEEPSKETVTFLESLKKIKVPDSRSGPRAV